MDMAHQNTNKMDEWRNTQMNINIVLCWHSVPQHQQIDSYAVVVIMRIVIILLKYMLIVDISYIL